MGRSLTSFGVLIALVVVLGLAENSHATHTIFWTGESWPLHADMSEGAGNGLALETDGGELCMWNAAWYSGEIRKIRLADSALVTQFTSPSCAEFPTCESAGLEFVGGYLWHVTGFGKIYQLDPSSGAKIDELSISSSPRGLTWDGGYFWTVDFDANSWYRFDFAGVMDPVYPTPFAHPGCIAWDGQFIWISSPELTYIYKFDPVSGAKLDSAYAGDLGRVRSLQIVPADSCWTIYIVPHDGPARFYKGVITEDGASATVPSTWGRVKAIYR
jgi:hypothetical protein